MSQKTIEITDGPSREELFDGLRLFAEKRLVPFTIVNNGRQMTPKAWIHGIDAEDGKGESWNIRFSIDESFIEVPFSLRSSDKKTFLVQTGSKTVKASYSTKTRKGVITVN